jgi:FdhE protein
MPLVALAASTRASRLDAATERWDALQESRPDLEPAISLQKQLVGLVLDLSEAIDQRPLPKLSLPPKYLAAKLARGTPILAGEPIPLPVGLMKPAFLAICDTLAEGGAGDIARHISALVTDGQLDTGSLLNASVTRDQQAIRTAAQHRGVSSDLLWLAAELTASPFVHALQRAMFAHQDEKLAGASEAWNQGYCAACGSWPALAEVVGGHRILRCSFCALAWELTTYACVYCGEEGEPFVTAAPDDERKHRRVEVCGSCGSYLKTLDLPELSAFPLLAITDLDTMDLDVATMEHGYQRPPMKDFAVGHR